MTGIAARPSSPHFQRFFGGISPLLVVGGAIVVAGSSLSLLKARGGFEVLRGRASLRGIALSAGLATVLAVVIVVADLFIRYPRDMNVPPPEALLFYPVVGYVAEVVFHVLPLTLLLLAFAPLSKGPGAGRLVGLCIVLTALLEPSFQLGFAETPLSWSGAYTWVHVFAISLLQRHVFRRYDFVSMYAFRLFYYAYWHIIWGVIRLELLF